MKVNVDNYVNKFADLSLTIAKICSCFAVLAA